MTEKKQVKSKQRVADHGEVFTNEREINAMLDLVSCETERLESRFLEPACGDGNFLVEILRRKMKIVSNKSRNDFDWKRNSAVVFSSIYGVELLADNANECRKRLFGVFYEEYYKERYEEIDEKFLNTIKYLLSTNIICGDALSLRTNEGTPLIFAEWGWIGPKVQRRDFELSGLLNESKQSYIDYAKRNSAQGQLTLFDDLPDEDFENAGLVKENVYRLMNYLELGDLYEKSRI